MARQERRRYRHVPFAISLTIVDEAAGRRYHGSSINMSKGGVGFFCEKFLQPNTQIVCVFHLGRGADRVDESVHAIVRWSKIDGDGAIGGAAFEQPLSQQEFPTLSDRLYAAVG